MTGNKQRISTMKQRHSSAKQRKFEPWEKSLLRKLDEIDPLTAKARPWKLRCREFNEEATRRGSPTRSQNSLKQKWQRMQQKEFAPDKALLSRPHHPQMCDRDHHQPESTQARQWTLRPSTSRGPNLEERAVDPRDFFGGKSCGTSVPALTKNTPDPCMVPSMTVGSSFLEDQSTTLSRTPLITSTGAGIDNGARSEPPLQRQLEFGKPLKWPSELIT